MLDQKRALHINSYFLTNTIHTQFYSHLRQRRGDQIIIPVHDHFSRDLVPDDVNVDFLFTAFDRKWFFPKVWKVVRLFLKRRHALAPFGYIHAHTLMSDGIPAYIISKLSGKPLVVSIRNTDITLFISRSRIFKFIGKHILNSSKAVFFISPSLKKKICSHYPSLDAQKYYSLPNGLADFWLQGTSGSLRPPACTTAIRLLFVGQIIPRKNLDVLINFLRTYDDKKYMLSVVGENTLGLDFDRLQQTLLGENEIHYLGKITDRGALKKVYAEHDVFVLLSLAETFGVVYIEAMSNGLPIVYSENEGMHGFFPEGQVGFSCDNQSISQLKAVLDRICADLPTMSDNAYQAAKAFSWDTIVENYMMQTKNIGNSEKRYGE